MTAIERQFTPARALDLMSTMRVLRRGSGDPTWLSLGPAAFAKGWNTPTGAVAVRLASGGGRVSATAWGPGASWLLDRLPALVGEDDDDGGFVARHEVVARLRHEFPGVRVPATGLVLESLVPSIIEQRVTGAEAFSGYRRLVRKFGTPAPGPLRERGLMVAPTAAGWAAVPSWEWLKAGVDGSRSATVARACVSPGRLEEAAGDPALAHRRLAAIPGVGRWTVAEVAHTALGDADAVSFGDYHVAKDVGWALLGRAVDDEGLAELLAPYAPHRYRVQRLVELAGLHRPRRGPRMSVPAHLPR